MIAAANMIQRIQDVYRTEPELTRTITCATSIVEVNLALDILRDHVPQRTLAAALSLRAILTSIPCFPCTMCVDEEALARIAHLEKDRLAWKKSLAPDCDLIVMMAGNFCFDVIIQADETSLFITPTSADTDLIDPAAVDVFLGRPQVLEAVIDLLRDMGIPFNPKMYLSLEDWALDYAQQGLEDIRSLF